MRELLNSLEGVDLSRFADMVRSLIQNADLWLMGTVVAFLVCLGHKMAIGHRVVYGWGLRLAALTVLGYGGFTVVQIGDVNEAMAPGVVFRVAVVAGGVLAASWILLPIVLFVYHNFRFGLVGFVGYVSYALVSAEALNSESLPSIAARGLLVAGLAMVLAWMLRPVWEFVMAHWPAQPTAAPATPAAAPPVPVATTVPATSDVKILEARLSRSERRRRRLARRQAAQTEVAVARIAEALTPLEIDARRRRSKACLDAELAYLLAAPQFGNLLPRELFDRWMAHYLGDHLPPEEVEENSRHLQKLLREQVKGSNANCSIEELHYWFGEEQRRLERANLDPAARQTKILALQELYFSLSQRFLAEPAGAVVPMLPCPQPELLAASLPYAEAASAGK